MEAHELRPYLLPTKVGRAENKITTTNNYKIHLLYKFTFYTNTSIKGNIFFIFRYITRFILIVDKTMTT